MLERCGNGPSSCSLQVSSLKAVWVLYPVLCLVMLPQRCGAMARARCGRELVEDLQFVCGDRGFHYSTYNRLSEPPVQALILCQGVSPWLAQNQDI